MKRMSKKDPKVEERIGVAAIAKVERARLLGGLERPELRGARRLRGPRHDLSSASRPSLSDFPQQGVEFKRHCVVTCGHSRSLSTERR